MVHRLGKKVGRRCAFESLENRRLLAGDVTAKIDHGNLVIKGDNLANGIAITAGASAGQVIITGVNAGGSATRVNGTSNGAITLSGFTGKLTIKMKSGDDDVTITGITANGKAKIKGENGNDTIEINDSTFNRSLTTKLGKGDDTLSITSTTVADKTYVSGSKGSDDATIDDLTSRKLDVSLGKDNDSLTVSDTTVSQKTRLNGKSGTDSYTDGTGNSFANSKIRGFDSSTTVPSNVTLNPVSAISEGGTATLTGTFKDSDITSIHTLKVGWGDPNSTIESTFAVTSTSGLTVGKTFTSSTDSTVLTITAVNTTTGEVSYSVQHKYQDDGAAGGNATGSDTSTITVTVTAGSTFNASKTTTVVINDAAPTVALDAVPAVSENGTVTLTGRYTDTGLLDGQTLTVNWGDPNSSSASTFTIVSVKKADGTANLTVGTTRTSTTDGATLTITAVDTTTGQVSFSVQHRYRDDGVSTSGNLTATDASTISVTVADDDGKSGNATTSVTVNNVAPTISVNDVAGINVNGTASVTGTYTDIGLSDEHGLLIAWGDNSSSQFRVNAINNSAGTATLTVGQTFTSVIANDTTILTITSINATTGQVGFSVGHKYTAVGAKTVAITVSDDDTGSVSASKAVNVGVVQPTVDVSPLTTTEGVITTLTGSFTNTIVTDTNALTVDWQDPNDTNESTFAVTATSGLSVGQTFNSTTDSAVLTITAVNTTTGQVSFSVKHLYTDDGLTSGNTTPSDASDVMVYVTGSTAGSNFKMVTVTVNNVAPTIDLSPVTVTQTGTATFTGTFTDVGLFDAHTFVIDWDDPNTSINATFAITRTGALAVNSTFNSSTDNAVLTITSVNTTTGVVGFSVQHHYLAAGSRTVSATIADNDSGNGSDTVSFTVGSA